MTKKELIAGLSDLIRHSLSFTKMVIESKDVSVLAIRLCPTPFTTILRKPDFVKSKRELSFYFHISYFFIMTKLRTSEIFGNQLLSDTNN
jgi:hypothetical protein